MVTVCGPAVHFTALGFSYPPKSIFTNLVFPVIFFSEHVTFFFISVNSPEGYHAFYQKNLKTIVINTYPRPGVERTCSIFSGRFYIDTLFL